MKRKIFLIITLFLLIAQSYKANGQFTPAEIAQREEIEKFLKTAEIVKYKDIREGVTKPIEVYLKKGDVERNGVWKNPSGIQKGYLEGWQYEIAAYEMDKLLGLNMVPPTVERRFRGKRGSLQLWVEHEYSDLERMEQKIQIPPTKSDHWSKMKYLMRAFDSLIANEDRTQQNIRYTKDWRMILIDHSRSFRSSKKFTEKLLFGKNAEGRPQPFRKLPRAFVEKIKTLNFDNIKKAVGPYLKDKEIKAILIRKQLLLEEIDEMIKEKGEDKVLY
ncbi:MAG: hypothetical protein ACE5K4_10565 [Candidatus Hydrothermarchaeota archaeon]